MQLEIAGVRDSGTFDTKREADEWNLRRTLELKAQGKAGPGSNKTLLDTLRRYAEEVTPSKRGKVKEAIRLKAFEDPEAHKHLPLKTLIHKVTSDQIGLWRNHRLTLNARGGVLRDLGLLSSVFSIAKTEWKWITANPVEDVTKPANPDHRERLIHGTEIRGVLRRLGYKRGEVRSVSQAVAQAFLLALMTGMRAGEICGLEWSRVRTDHVILLTLSEAEATTDGKGTTKTGRSRQVPLSKAARRIIKRMKGWDPELVFGIQSQTLDTLFRRARDRAKLSGFTFHDSRHTACTHLARKIDVLDLCKMMGWVKTTQALTYYNPKVSDIAKRLG
ncbi:tyrosine-type recombinase/integrase [Variovorax ureilyticus]|uniref:tyrosine-type recombinase/integrase n=1 Tax=Variovorax ureilyticus TaxID=1836198 RepID=UPI003D6777F6